MEKSEVKTHYRKVFKSDHLGIADLEDFLEEKVILVFTIAYVKQEIGVQVAGKKGSFNIAYFVEPIKPLVLNATNSKVVKSLAGGSPFVEDWKNISVELYIDPTVKLMKETVGGVRIKEGVKPLPELLPTSISYPNAVTHIRGGGSIDDIKKKFTISEATQKQIMTDAI